MNKEFLLGILFLFLIFSFCIAEESVARQGKVMHVVLQGEIQKGYQRGRTMNLKTANIDPFELGFLLDGVQNGVYGAFASVEGHDGVFEAVVSIGNNPQFENKSGTVETHILHEFEEDFYGAQLRVVLILFIRRQQVFSSLDVLKYEINSDIEFFNNWLVENEDMKKTMLGLDSPFLEWESDDDIASSTKILPQY
ncbi:Riboflavin kinase like protein [Aduncisulcus paluster]|uniref:riboflavin kinase n=1 Tax=Aduncisulcus paluster TaxID=2918883 RepID=A0ABQ5JZP1_9EUKA|nr:Riboflavin kinase like protein [Aduncisulcus paluster]|eukprot:gnl/Carplike_NY0171/4795_a6532_348.p1 GENE.gnl/Carplike_NY0171/4795_a6532_348~~gnl/Carplike_NY0171/4795_a6532_348.p1  ORF type:complete len:195 (-),score=32.73 gnl/Carplike_NY0171/4795_a6532_348:469-1053(-)